MERYLALSKADSETLLGDSRRRQASPCPGCGADAGEPAFEKHGFTFRECEACGSLYVSPRPRGDDLDRFYRESPSSRFWANEFFPAVADARRERIIRPRVQRILERPSVAALETPTVIDVGAGSGAFLSEFRAARPDWSYLAIEPGRELADQCRDAGIDVIEAPADEAEGAAGRGDVVTSFEVIEHVHDPVAFVRSLARLARPGGTVLVTGLGGDGLDVQVLWDRSNAVSPPHHLNFVSVKGFERLFERAGLVDVEVETPGELDVELVQKAVADGRAPELPRFLVRLLRDRDESVLADFQRFLQRARMSSHTWIWARRPA